MAPTIELHDEGEGERVEVASDFFFERIGEPLPVTPASGGGDNCSKLYDMDCLPSQPLAISDRHQLTFVAHSSGFCVARTRDVMEAAKKICEKGSGSCVLELSIVDVPLGRVHLLSLCPDSSTLAAAVGGTLSFFSVASLLSKVQVPNFSCSIDRPSYVKDMRWLKKMKNYVLLSNGGNLYLGSIDEPLKFIMDNVDAVDCSVKDTYIAVAKNSKLSILSSKLEHKLTIALSFQQWTGESDGDSIMKVDSIRWVRPDCIVLGCLQIKPDGAEENYLVQVIRIRGGKTINASDEMVVKCFDDVFPGIVDNIVPAGSGPHLFFSYLKWRPLAIAANRKNRDQHVVLFSWSLGEEKNEVVLVDFVRDKWLPRIELQENGDDNLIVGLCTDEVSVHEKVRVQLGVEEPKDLSSFCILFCLSLEGKLIMFKVASVAESRDFTDTDWLSDEKEDNFVVEHVERTNSTISSEVEEGTLQLQDLKMPEHKRDGIEVPLQSDSKPYEVNRSAASDITINQKESKEPRTGKLDNSFAPSQVSDADGREKSLAGKHITDKHATPFLGQQYTALDQPILRPSLPKESLNFTEGIASSREFSRVGSTSVSFAEGYKTSSTNQSLQNVADSGKDVAAEKVSTGFQTSPSVTWPSGTVTSTKSSDSRFTLASNQFGSNKSQSAAFSIAPANVPSLLFGEKVSKEVAEPPHQVSSFGVLVRGGQKVQKEVGKIEPLPFIRSSQTSLQESSAFVVPSSPQVFSSMENLKSLPQSRMSKMDPTTSKQSGNIKKMIHELDTLLDSIVKKGGFKDACTLSLNGPVEEIEQRIGSLSKQCMMWKGLVDERLEEVKCLLDKTVQVLGRKTFVEGIVRQAKDDQYWELWSRQNLNAELELKRYHILKLNQDLTNQLIELERHFNTMELKNFGDISGSYGVERALQNKLGSSRSVYSLQSLYSTMTSQIVAAEQLSQCLARQMSVLSIESPPAKPKNVKKELFDEIGISYDASFSSPDAMKLTNSSLDKIMLSNSISTKDRSRINQASALKTSEPETARRRRDSLDKSWASFEPSKTTVKRMLLQGHQSEGTRSPLLIDEKHRNSSGGSAVARANHSTPLSAFTRRSRMTGMHEKSGDKASENDAISYSLFSAPKVTFGSERTKTSDGSNNLIADKSVGEATSEKSKSVLSSETKSIPDTNIHPMPTVSTKSPMQSSKKTGETFGLINKDSMLPKSTSENVKYGPPVSENSSFGHARSENSLSTPTQSVPLATSISNKVPQVDSASGKSLPGESLSFSTSFKSTSSPSMPNLSSTPLSSSSNVASIKAGSTSQVTLGESWTTSRATTDVNQSLPFSFSSSASFASVTSPSLRPSSLPSSAFSFSNQASKMLETSLSSTIFSSVTSPSPPPSSSPSSSFSFSNQSSKTLEASLSSSLPLDLMSKPQNQDVHSDLHKVSQGLDVATPSEPIPVQPEHFAGGFALKEVSLSSTPIELSSVPVSSVQGVSSHIASPASSKALDAELEQPSTGNFFPTPFLSSGNPTSQKTEILVASATQEDEMEEVAPETNDKPDIGLGNLSAFGLGSTPSSATAKGNPFSVSFGNASTAPASSPFAMTVPSGELFRPASFSFQSLQNSQPSQPPNINAFSGGFGASTNAQAQTIGGFGQPSQIGPGQPALGSVLGAFGQSRQIGSGLVGAGFASASSFGGGFASTSTTGGFPNAATSGGFAALASSSGGFAGIASAGAGGFAGAASGVGGGFSSAASGGGGFGSFASAATSGAGFGRASSGGFPSTGGVGFGAFGSQPGAGGFSAFSSGGGGGGGNNKPPQLFTQIRK